MTSETPKPRTGPQSQWLTLCVHAGKDREPKPRGAVADPIFCSLTYAFADTQSLIDFIEKKLPREEYARYGNPTEKTVERKLAVLEGAEDCVLYATGMAAVTGLLLAKLNAGDELVFFDELYQRTRELCENELSRFGIVTRIVPTGDFAALEAAITPATRLLFCESPTNPQLSVIDLPRFAALGRKHGIDTAVEHDDGLALQRPPAGIRHRLCPAFMHQVPGGAQRRAGRFCRREQGEDRAVAEASRLHRRDQRPARRVSAAARPEDVRLRMERHNSNAQAAAEFLAAHPRIERVYYPGLPDHPNYEIARRTMRGCGGVVTFTVKDADWRQTAEVVDALRLPQIAASLGGVESLVEQPLILSYYEFTPQKRKELGIPDNMIRLSCGIENTEDIIADLKQALETVPSPSGRRLE